MTARDVLGKATDGLCLKRCAPIRQRLWPRAQALACQRNMVVESRRDGYKRSMCFDAEQLARRALSSMARTSYNNSQFCAHPQNLSRASHRDSASSNRTVCTEATERFCYRCSGCTILFTAWSDRKVRVFSPFLFVPARAASAAIHNIMTRLASSPRALLHAGRY